MPVVVVSAYEVASKPEIGGHFWVYMQYAHALQQLECDVYWLECVPRSALLGSPSPISNFLERMERYGFGGRTLLYTTSEVMGSGAPEFIGTNAPAAEAVFRRTDLLLNFHYAIDRDVLARFRRTALIDIDPGLLQFWISRGQLDVAPHDLYLTTGETLGTPNTRVDDCGYTWTRIRPPVCLDLWPFTYDPSARRFTTVSAWLGGEYVTENGRILYRNDKSISFLRFSDLPGRTTSELELGIYLEGRKDRADRILLEQKGWHIRHALDVAGSPESYRDYIQSSRGEFSCAKPSCMVFQNAWVSDRSLCYLASGKPVVVQHTGPSAYLPNGEGMFRFATIDEAAEALASIESDYERQCRAAREIAESFFDARIVLSEILDLA
jgi:hypothetical protein